MTSSIRRQPFVYARTSKGVTDPQITHDELQAELHNLAGKAQLVMFIRAYVQERTPACFSSEPMLWESIREWFASRLQVHPREIGLSGSAQSGFSLKASKRGEPFDPNSSDLDFFVVSEDYFKKLEHELRLFVARVNSSQTFADQGRTVENQWAKGYVDLHQIPAKHDKYPLAAKALNDVSIIIDRLKLHNFNLKPSHLRVYKNWASLGQWVQRSYSNPAFRQ